MSDTQTRGPIAVLGGTGSLGYGLALRWARAGETVIIGSREPARAKAAAAEIKQHVGESAQVSGMGNAAACAAANIVVLSVPFENQAETLKQLKLSLKPDTVLIDCTVPLASSVGGRASRMLGVWQGSAAEQAAELLPKGVSIACAFQNVSADLLRGDAPLDCDVIVCSDDPEATRITRELAAKIPGIRALDGGRLENSRLVEPITALLVGLSIRHKGHGGIRVTGLPEEAYK